MLISDTEKQKSTGTVYSRRTFDSREDVGCANLLRQVSFKFYNTLKEKKSNLGDLTRQQHCGHLICQINLSFVLILRREYLPHGENTLENSSIKEIKQLTSNQSK